MSNWNRRGAILFDSHRSFTTRAISFRKGEELNERLHALLLTAARKAFGSN